MTPTRQNRKNLPQRLKDVEKNGEPTGSVPFSAFFAPWREFLSGLLPDASGADRVFRVHTRGVRGDCGDVSGLGLDYGAMLIDPETLRRTPRLFRRGFTLIEMLVVISIIALLIALLMPSIKRSRESARAVNCLSNQRQVLLGIAHYAEDYLGTVPASYAYGEGNTWASRVRPYLPSVAGDPNVGAFFSNAPPPRVRTVLHCPSEPTHGGPVLRFGYSEAIYGNIREDYSINALRSGRTGRSPPYNRGGVTDFFSLIVNSPAGLKQNYVGLPSATFLLADAVYMDIEPADTYFNTGVDHALIYRHHQGNVAGMGFFDGHAELHSFPVPANGYPGAGDNLMPIEAPW